MKKVITIFFILSANFLLAQEGSWDYYSTMKNPVAGGIAQYQNGSVFISGGYSSELQGNVTWIQEYNMFWETQEIVGNMQNTRYGHESFVFNDKLYFVGGINDSAEVNSSLEEWDISIPDTTLLVASDSNFNRIFSTGVTHNNFFYLIGGNPYSDKDSNILPYSYIIEYDIENDSITYEYSVNYENDFPEQQMSVVYGDDIFIFGGVSNGVLQSIQKFNTQTHTLDTLEVELLEPRAGGVAILNRFSNEIFIIGGFNEGNSALKSVEILTINGANYNITSGEELNEARTNLMGISPSFQEIIVLGGYSENGEVLNSIEWLGSYAVSRNDSKSQSFSFQLEQNYPNPFNPSTTIKYSIPSNMKNEMTNVKLVIFNILGQEILTVVNKQQKAGNYEINFNAKDLSSGIYFYKLQAGSYVKTKKMTVLR